MKVRVLGAFGGEGLGQRPSSFLVNDRVLVDAGNVTGALTVKEQLAVEHALISHSHLDHTCGLAYLAETLGTLPPRTPVTIASAEPVVNALRTSMFNNVLWPDFSRIPSAEQPVLRFRSLVEEAEQRVGDLWVTPVAVSHTVPTFGFIVHDGDTGFVYSGDTGPTVALWKAARGLRSIRAVILECAYPDRLGDLAAIAGHLTPALVRRELDKLPPNVPVWIFHVKPQYQDETVEELSRIDSGRVLVVEQDKTYVV
ncbi:MAG: 3',5'-cyclic-nucleotide phosphodiesterase [Candidatus Rokubacteria bacterium]|nr:3',5'-cyclic-nucleotide phosphodiesterase [Candidatus Rokubacteria bacterium]MBI3826160.1 3',5'-cyclic-nucleotide phosphodiesterase [Candidatus Rokubacteria bacterium]